MGYFRVAITDFAVVLQSQAAREVDQPEPAARLYFRLRRFDPKRIFARWDKCLAIRLPRLNRPGDRKATTDARSGRRDGGSLKYPEVRNYLAGSFVGAERPYLEVHNPSDGSVISRVPLSTQEDVDSAVASARKAGPAWSATPIKERVQVFYRYKALLEKNIDELAALITEENGKVASEARAEVLKSAELCEFACSLPQITPGEVLEVSRGVECRIERYPLGVVAAITPFNFPNMVPNWSLPNAIALGNCLILKPS
ncbi:MAG: aldehyde dehydrogenase family protein, partial [Gemmatimonadaceae bacterium]